MSGNGRQVVDIGKLTGQIVELRRSLETVGLGFGGADVTGKDGERFINAAGGLLSELQRVRVQIAPTRFGSIGITLGRSDGIAKFFAFSFVNQDKRDLDTLAANPFHGSGVYAIYYHGSRERAYLPLSGTETPIYVGKADPKDPQAETVEEQGATLHRRLKEHVKSIDKTGLRLTDFRYRYAIIQSGMQAAVEDFMIRLFRPIWNKEVGICFGIGKHGDSATTRANKRSPWDTIHPGRAWAAGTTADQMKRVEIKSKIAAHFAQHPVIPDKDALFKMLSLG